MPDTHHATHLSRASHSPRRQGYVQCRLRCRVHRAARPLANSAFTPAAHALCCCEKISSERARHRVENDGPLHAIACVGNAHLSASLSKQLTMRRHERALRFRTLRHCIAIATILMAGLPQSWLLYCVARCAQASLARRTFEIVKRCGAVMMLVRDGPTHREWMPEPDLRSNARPQPQLRSKEVVGWRLHIEYARGFGKKMEGFFRVSAVLVTTGVTPEGDKKSCPAARLTRLLHGIGMCRS